MAKKEIKSEEPTTALEEVLTEAGQLNNLNESIFHVNKSLELLQEMYESKPQNPIGSAINVLELLKMNLIKLKPIPTND